MRAAVVGTGWGQVHITALQQLGVDVVALCGADQERTSEVARDRGIAHAFTGIGDLPRLDLDLITIAAPTSMHANMVAALGPTPLLCEKPAVGVETPVTHIAEPSGPVWVNYAFPFLDVALQADSILTDDAGGIGRVVRIEAHSGYDLGQLVTVQRTPWQWLTCRPPPAFCCSCPQSWSAWG